jgi:ADP-heptose:LPS heptosyltransferase
MSFVPLLQRPDIASVVVFRALQVGDMLCAVPALRALRAALPQAHITLVGLPWAQQFAARYSRYLDDFLAFPGHPSLPEAQIRDERAVDVFYETVRARKFALALQLHGSGQLSNPVVRAFGAAINAGYAPADGPECDGVHYFPYPDAGLEPLRLLALVHLLGAPEADPHLEFPLTPADWQELHASGVDAGLVPGRYACIHAGASSRDKCWPPQCFAEIADRLAEEFGLTIVFTGSGKETALAEEVMAHMRMPAINAAAPISIGAMAALMSRARLLVCNDTSVSHIAAGFGLKSVVVFSQADMKRWAPQDAQRHRGVWDPDGERLDEVWAQVCDVLDTEVMHSPQTVPAPSPSPLP